MTSSRKKEKVTKLERFLIREKPADVSESAAEWYLHEGEKAEEAIDEFMADDGTQPVTMVEVVGPISVRLFTVGIIEVL